MGDTVRIGFRKMVPIGEVIANLFKTHEAVKAGKVSQKELDIHWFKILAAQERLKQAVARRDELRIGRNSDGPVERMADINVALAMNVNIALRNRQLMSELMRDLKKTMHYVAQAKNQISAVTGERRVKNCRNDQRVA
jgi:hypothetical protein